ncbi:MAG: GNAT family N-acetyltransferase [Candidatus Shapirobacteria bacterium]
MDVKIKKARTKDWKVIQKLNNQVYLNDKKNDDDLDLTQPFTEKGIKYYKDLAEGKYGHCLIAFLDNKPVGYIALAKKSFSYRKSKYVEVENMGVDPEYRSKGIGKKLMDAGSKWAKSTGAAKMWVVAYWGNKEAIKFYKKNGFYESGLELDKKL